MVTSLLDELIGLTPEDVKLLKTLNHVGAATAEEVALKLNRPGDDLTPWMEQLVQRNMQVYQVDPLVRKSLHAARKT